MAQAVSRRYFLPIAGIMGCVVLARVMAVQVSRVALRDCERGDLELLFWMLSRGLITAVLALEIVQARGRDVCIFAGDGVCGDVDQ